MIAGEYNLFVPACVFFHYTYIGLITGIILIIAISLQIGYAAWLGLGLYMFLFLPLQAYVSKRFSEIQKDTSRLSDIRVKKTNEILLGKRVYIYNP